jgi:hypothetical protein
MTTTLTQSAYNPNLTDEQFDEWRKVQDDDVDYLASMLIKSPHWRDVYKALKDIQYNNELVDISIFRSPTDTDTIEDHDLLVKQLNNYFNNDSEFDFLTDHAAMVKRACEFFCRHANDAIFILAVRSLLKQYAAFNATNVLVNTKLLVQYPHRRIFETMQFVIDVMDVNGFEPTGKAKRSLQKLRLIHSLIRARFNREQTDPNYEDEAIREDWKAEWGLPINQQDMIFALHTFSIEILDGLKAKGVRLTKHEINDYYLTWHYYGKVLGIPDAINPTTYKEGKALQERIYKKQFKKDNPNGKVLAYPLIDFMKRLLPLNRNRHIFAIVKLYNDKKDYKPIFEDILQLEMYKAAWYFMILMKYAGHLWEWVIKLSQKLSSGVQKESFQKVLEMKNFSALQKLVSLELEYTGKQPGFNIGDGLGEDASKEDEEMEEKQPNILARIINKLLRA